MPVVAATPISRGSNLQRWRSQRGRGVRRGDLPNVRATIFECCGCTQTFLRSQRLIRYQQTVVRSARHSEYRLAPGTARARQVAAKDGIASDDGPPVFADVGLFFDVSTEPCFRANHWRGQLKNRPSVNRSGCLFQGCVQLSSSSASPASSLSCHLPSASPITPSQYSSP